MDTLANAASVGNDTAIDNGNLLSAVVPAFGNMGRTLQAVLHNFSSIMAFSGIKTTKGWTLTPLSVIIAVELCLLFAVRATTYLLRKPPIPAETVDSSEGPELNKKAPFKGRPFIKLLYIIFITVPFGLFVMSLPVSFFFSLFYFTRGYIPKHTEVDMTTIALVTDAIYCGIFFIFQTALIGNLFSAFRRPNSEGKVWKWKTFNIDGQLVGTPRFVLVPAAMLSIVVFALSPDPANDLMFFPVILLSYLWASVKNTLVIQKGRPFKSAFIKSMINASCIFLYIYMLSFCDTYFHLKQMWDLGDVHFGVNQRVMPWSIYFGGLSLSAGMIEFMIWCFRFDYERARKDTIPTAVEISNHFAPVEAEGPRNLSSRVIIMTAYVRNFGNGAPGQYFRVATAIWAISNLALYFTVHSCRIYLGGPFYAFLSSFLSQVSVSAGVSVLALVRGDLSSLWKYEAKALLEMPTKKKSVMKKEKWSVEDLIGINMGNGEDSKEGKEILVEV